MKFVWILAILVLGASAREVPATRVSCRAFAALKIRIVGTAKCAGTGKANCEVITTAVDDFKDAYDTWWSPAGSKCSGKEIEVAANAVATASAKVYVSSLANVKCEGAGGFACGFAISEGSGLAQAIAHAIAQAAVDATSVDSDAFCISDVEAVAGAVAEAAAKAQSKACVKGTGSQADFQNAFVEAVKKALADAYVKAAGATCDAEGKTAASSSCFGEGEGKTKGDVIKGSTPGATSSGSVTSLELCPSGMDHCCDSSYKKPICKCDGPPCEGTWILGPQRSWVKGSERCLCPRLSARGLLWSKY